MNKYKFLLEFTSLIMFFTIYKFYGLINATISLICTTTISTLLMYKKYKKIEPMAIITCVLLVIFGGITIFTQDTSFIKMKPTIIYLLFATILVIGIVMKKNFLEKIFNKIFKLNQKQWKIFTLQWICFFIILAIINEFIWRNFGEDIWIKSKIFYFPIMTIVFIVLQVFYWGI